MKKVLVTGASGLIGGFLVKSLLDDGFSVRAVGRRPVPEWKQVHEGAENLSLDLSLCEHCHAVMKGIDEVYNLAAEIGGVNFIEKYKAQTMLSVLINTHLLMAARDAKTVKRYFYASTYGVSVVEVPQAGLALTQVLGDSHVWEKLFSEKLCQYFRSDYGLEIRIGRLQNVYGPYDEYDSGKERAPAALSRKAIIAKHTGKHDLEIWGDGKQVRSFLHSEDAAEGVRKLMDSDIADPVRIGSREFVTINDVVDVVESLAGIKFNRKYNTSAPSGAERKLVPDKAADKRFGWSPKKTFKDGMREMYQWIENDMKKRGKV